MIVALMIAIFFLALMGLLFMVYWEKTNALDKFGAALIACSNGMGIKKYQKFIHFFYVLMLTMSSAWSVFTMTCIALLFFAPDVIDNITPISEFPDQLYRPVPKILSFMLPFFPCWPHLCDVCFGYVWYVIPYVPYRSCCRIEVL